VPALFDAEFPGWFAGVAYAAIGIGALVSAAIMSIAAANLWTRNIYREYLAKRAKPKQEATQAKWASLVVKFGAVLFIVFVDPQFSIDLQLIGGVIILQTLPAVAIALYTRWLHSIALIAGWVAGMTWGLYLLWLIPNPATDANTSVAPRCRWTSCRSSAGSRSPVPRCRSTSGSWRWPRISWWRSW
jgi:solute:Na+ symporter, SSS family